MKAEWEKSYCNCKAHLSQQKWNSPVSSGQHSYFETCPFEADVWGLGVGGGGGQGFISSM